MWVPFYLMIAGIAALAVEDGKGNRCPDLARFTFDFGDGVLGTDHADCGACLVVDDHRLAVRCPARIWTGRNDKAAKR